MQIVQYEEQRLSTIEAATRLLAEAKTIEEVAEVRNYAEAVRLVARQAKAGLGAQNQAAELKLRAERRGGEMLEQLRADGEVANHGGNRSSRLMPVTLNDVGITKNQVSNWQRIAAIPETKFEQHIETTQKNGKELTTAGTMKLAKNYKLDTKRTVPRNVYEPQGYDACQTPPYALEPLLPYIRNDMTIWESAAGEGSLVEAFYDAGIKRVLISDMLSGENFLEYEPGERWDCIITNPPYSLKYDFLARCYELGTPFALLVPVEIIGSGKAQALMQQYGFEIMLLSRRVDFKMPNAGWSGSGSPFPTLWLCWQLLPAPIMFGDISLDVKKAFHNGRE